MEIDLGDTFGAMLIGALITMAVYGITTLQMYFYYMHYPKDSLGLKFLVALIWILDTLHVILMCHAMHFYLITGFGNPKALVNGTWSLYTSIAINILMAFISQFYFTVKIYHLSPPKVKIWLTGVIGLSVVAHFCFGIETVVFFFLKKEFARLKEVLFESVLPFGILAIASDIFIALALCILLHGSRSDFVETNNLINKLIVIAINRCVLTSAVAVIEVIVFVILPQSFYTFAFDFIIGKLYANSLLATLNARRMLQAQEYSVSITGELTTDFQMASMATYQGTNDSIIRTRSRGGVARRGLGIRVGDVGKEEMSSSTTQEI
ncbi:hypothetical protein AMATHDRAFT_55837 [Amanita thiersii Skay4041]|uniref:DUF6534 domain-containing protein n=1 Tax=Amanita thiersii Skay4041 TaxID=703135 RepID=A0A2A9NYJ5_9AGAR|nr:hypothetical protein AMATHDRAFT_55837 [Amanita thiersii Skay4041]